MIKRTYTTEDLEARGIVFEEQDNALRVSLPDEPGGFYVTREGNELTLFPERSSAQKRLVELLDGEIASEP